MFHSTRFNNLSLKLVIFYLFCIYLVISNLNNLIGFERLTMNKRKFSNLKISKYSFLAAKR